MSELRDPRTYAHLAWQNVRRNTRRSLLTATAILVAVAASTFMQSYMKGILGELIDSYARMETGHVRITRTGFIERERFQPLYLNVPYLSEILPVVRSLPGVAAALPRIRTGALVDTGEDNTQAMVVGLDLAAEQDYFRPQEILHQGDLPRSGHAEALLGTTLASDMRIALGDTITLLCQTVYRSFGGLRVEVTGLGATGIAFLDRGLILLPIDQAQVMTEMGDGATEIVAFAKAEDQTDLIAATLRDDLSGLVPEGLDIVPWTEQGGLIGTMQSMGAVWKVMMGILLLMAAMVIINTMQMSVFERTRELGMLAAMGMRRGEVMGLILTEGLLLGVVGSLVGGALGTGAALWLQKVGIDVTSAMSSADIPMQGIIYPQWDLSQLLLAVALGVATAVLASLYPARRAVRMQPADALRS